MWNKLTDILSSQQNPDSSGRDADDGSLRRMINASGRIPYNSIYKLAATHDERGFIELLGYPVLVGSAIKEGAVEPRDRFNDKNLRRKTHLFKPADFLSRGEIESDSLQQAIYIFTKFSVSLTEKGNRFIIGRTAGNDFVVPDFAVSERHASIETNSGRYFLTDLNSTNGTRVNGARVYGAACELKDKDTVTFARYDFTFLKPSSFFALLRER